MLTRGLHTKSRFRQGGQTRDILYRGGLHNAIHRCGINTHTHRRLPIPRDSLYTSAELPEGDTAKNARLASRSCYAPPGHNGDKGARVMSSVALSWCPRDGNWPYNWLNALPRRKVKKREEKEIKSTRL